MSGPIERFREILQEAAPGADVAVERDSLRRIMSGRLVLPGGPAVTCQVTDELVFSGLTPAAVAAMIETYRAKTGL